MTLTLEGTKREGKAEALPSCYVCKEAIEDLGDAYHISEGLHRHIGCDPSPRQAAATTTPKKKDLWWQVKDRSARNLKAIKDAFAGHEYTFQEFGVVIRDYDIGVINAELGEWKTIADRDKRLLHLVHYWVAAVLRAIRARAGEDVGLEEVEGYRNFQSLYQRALKRDWKARDDKGDLRDKVIEYIKTKATVSRGQLAKRFGIPSKEIKKLLRESVAKGEVYSRGSYFYS